MYLDNYIKKTVFCLYFKGIFLKFILYCVRIYLYVKMGEKGEKNGDKKNIKRRYKRGNGTL